jgi:RNA polymerase sigma-70 factor (ECF subfamily)
LREVIVDDAEAVLLEILDSARRVYPTFRVPRDVFLAYLCARLPTDVPRSRSLRQVHALDLYLACACARGDTGAFAAFDDHCLGHLDRVMGRMGIDADTSADIKQDIRNCVLIGDGGPAKIADFSGRGDLRGWVRVMAIRLALRCRSRTRREVCAEDDELLQRIAGPGNPELACAKASYRREFQRAFESALRALPDRQQILLRQHHVDGLTIDELGRLYRVHRATAARMLDRARACVLEATRARMKYRLGVQSQDLDSIIRLIRSQIEISLRGLGRGRAR